MRIPHTFKMQSISEDILNPLDPQGLFRFRALAIMNL